MKIWFDTEFYEDGRTIDLISIGMVREDGATYYAETYDALSVASRSDWLKENVFPHLTGPVRTRDELRADILEFAGEKPEFWAYYADYDWVLLCQLFGRMIDLPEGWPMFCRDVQQLRAERGVADLPKQIGAEHNALGDAVWTREAWQFLNSSPVHHVELCPTCDGTGKEARHQLCRDCDDVASAPETARGRWLSISLADKTITDVTQFPVAEMVIKMSDRYWVRDEDGRVYEAAWSEGNKGDRDYWWDFEGESPVDPVEFMPHPLDPRFSAASEGSTDA